MNGNNALPAGLNKAELAGWVADWISSELKIDRHLIAEDTPFVQFGLDSVHAMMMVGDLEDLLGRRLSPTLTWRFPTLGAMAEHLVQEAPATATAPPSTEEDADILAHLDELSEEEIDQLLQQRLNSNTR